MEGEIPSSKVIPCKDIKNENYVEILRELEEGNSILTSPSGDKFLATRRWGIIPILNQHPLTVKSGTIYLFNGNNRIQQITRGRFKQQGRKTNLRNSNKEIVGKKSNLILENHLQEGLIFRKHTMSLLSMEKPVLIHYSSETHSSFEVQLRDDDDPNNRNPIQRAYLEEISHLSSQSSSSLSSLSSPLSSRSSPLIPREIDQQVVQSTGISLPSLSSLSGTPKVFAVLQENNSSVVIKITGSNFSADSMVIVDHQKVKTAHAGPNELWFTLPQGYSNSRPSIFIIDKEWKSQELRFAFSSNDDRMRNLAARVEKLEEALQMKPRADSLSSPPASELSTKSLPDFKSLETRVQSLENLARPTTNPNPTLAKIRDITNPTSDVPSLQNFSPFHFFPANQPSFTLPNIGLAPPVTPTTLNFLSRKRTLPGQEDDLANILTKFSKN